jgi:hypothetical protein
LVAHLVKQKMDESEIIKPEQIPVNLLFKGNCTGDE